jgi:hypothetical protein
MFKPAVVVVCLVALCCSLPSLASAANCDEWQGPSGGDWNTAANWNGGVPTAGTDVCLDNSLESGSYTVDIDTSGAQAPVANSITIGGSAGNVVTLAILGALTVNTSLINDGTIEVGSVGGTNGTLDIASGTFTNDGKLVFENTANGPDGLDGTLVNNGPASALGPVQGTGQITNEGEFSLTAGTTFGATSYSQGASGALSIAITGGAAPMLPELQLSGAAQLGGALEVGTTGTATGTFPLISDAGGSGTFTRRAFEGETFSLAYASTGVGLTGPAVPFTIPPAPGPALTPAPAPTPAPTTPVLRIGQISGGTAKLSVRVSCSGATGSCSSASIKASVVEHLRRGRLTAVRASQKAKAKTVRIASGSITLAAGQAKTLTLSVNRPGKALLAKYGRISTKVTVRASGKMLATAKVTVRKAGKKRTKKKEK